MLRQMLSLLVVCCVASATLHAETPPALLPASFNEPPMAEPGEVKPAPESAVVVPGQLPPQFQSSPAINGITPAQYIVPTSANPHGMPANGVPGVLPSEPPTPTVRISIKGIETAPTGQEITYRLTATNTSDARAHNVIVRCPLPRGAKLVKAMPQPNAEAKEMEWHLETLEPGATRLIDIVFKPAEDATEISVVGKVQFEHGRIIKTKIVNPKLELKQTGQAQGILHEPMTYKIIANNPGQVAVMDIQIVNSLPDGLEYVQEASSAMAPASKVGPAPNQRTWSISCLQPGETPHARIPSPAS